MTEEAAEMTGCGRRGKPKPGFPRPTTSHWKSLTAISTFPQPRLTTAMGKWKSNNRIPTFPRLIALFRNQKRKEINPGLLTSSSGSSLD
jgi:hypothetical protein